MKTSLNYISTLVWMGAFLLSAPSLAEAQNKNAQSAQVSHRGAKLQQPTAPSDIEVVERTISDLLYFPYGCLPATVTNDKEAQDMLSATFGVYEHVNNIYYGLHRSGSFSYTYRGVPIGLSYIDWYDNRNWYEFYFDTRSEAQQFYTDLADDIRQAGIPLTQDRVYGGLSNRKRPVSIFKHVFVTPPSMIKEADGSNIHGNNVVGKYVVELGVYKRQQK